MAITQEHVNRIKQECKSELTDIFGDIENIDFVTAILIAVYCNKRKTFHDINKEPIEYNYWFSMAKAYDEAVKATFSTLEKLEILRK
jgi:hypothetical protein